MGQEGLVAIVEGFLFQLVEGVVVKVSGEIALVWGIFTKGASLLFVFWGNSVVILHQNASWLCVGGDEVHGVFGVELFAEFPARRTGGEVRSNGVLRGGA